MSGHSAEKDAPKPSWVRGLRVRSTHDAYRAIPYTYGIDTTPCFCWADSIHPVGQEQTRVIPPDEWDEEAEPICTCAMGGVCAVHDGTTSLEQGTAYCATCRAYFHVEGGNPPYAVIHKVAPEWTKDNEVYEHFHAITGAGPLEQVVEPEPEPEPVSHVTTSPIPYHDDPLAPARGIRNALLLSIPFWLVIGYFFWVEVIR